MFHGICKQTEVVVHRFSTKFTGKHLCWSDLSLNQPDIILIGVIEEIIYLMRETYRRNFPQVFYKSVLSVAETAS